MTETMWDLTGKALSLVEHSEDIDPTVFSDTLESLKEPIKEKAVNIKKVDDELELKQNSLQAQVETFKKKSEPLKARIKTIQSKRDFLKENILNGMNAVGIRNIKTNDTTIFTTSRTHYDYQENKIPASYYKPKYVLDKDEVKKDVKAGKEVPGVIKSTKQTVTFK
ncbi:siphovirus Gp157 family protein [Companilactobacillus crustorum]|uniref:siphovirus Gp157 family protein n=1 Tax=Companilactobacillus crustorum TaxID=392416 RepID=UPI00237E0C09|nr:siphovirus Gp157 family protein [Companilactobacillus crustorum]WDT64733.1 siphovirus Gp157 family protein [Companilactobacillus crustorum]